MERSDCHIPGQSTRAFQVPLEYLWSTRLLTFNQAVNMEKK